MHEMKGRNNSLCCYTQVVQMHMNFMRSHLVSAAKLLLESLLFILRIQLP